MGFVPVVIEVILETVVVEMHVETVHFVISHVVNELIEIVERDVLSPGINHETAHRVIGHVRRGAYGELLRLPQELQKGLGAPDYAFFLRR